MKRGIVGACAAAVLGLAALAPGTASAALVCTPTDFVREGRPLTAALVNPVTVPEHVDATSCDIGIYFKPGFLGGTGTGSLTDKHVFGATHYGILVNGGNVAVADSSVFDIEDNPTFTGVQHGIGLAVVDGGSLTVERTQVYDYQKNGLTADGAGTVLHIRDSIVRGKGPTPVIAQNGIQFSRSATGSAIDNVIQDHQYTGCSNQDSHETGCTPFVSTGILLFEVDPTLIERKNNLFRDNDFNVLNAQ